ncbi:MAG: amino acid ABC transporter substrate-binding protein [Flavobacteriaceae bacterium]
MKKILFSLLFVFGVCTTINAQGFREHKIAPGETIHTIIEMYKVTPYELFQLNPDAEESVSVGDVIVLLKNNQYPFDASLIGLMKYKVKKKETLADISKAHGVSETDIKKYNTRLYANDVVKGDNIKIPVFDKTLTYTTPKQPVEVVEVSTTTINSETLNHVVQPKEGKYGISKKYGISIEELEQQNPHIKEGLKIGQVLTITKKQVVEEVSETPEKVENSFALYTVQPKEGFYRLAKKLGVSKDSLIALNPQLSEGIKLGMQIRYPVSKFVKQEVKVFNLLDSITNYEPQHITLLLPLRLNKIVETDSTSNIKERLLRDRTVNTALDFYSGAMMAIDSMSQLGISTKLTIFDTEYNGRDAKANKLRIEEFLNQSFEENEVVIGPLVSSNVSLVAEGLERQNIPVIAPFPIKTTMPYKNLYETAMPVNEQKNNAIAFLEQYAKDKKVIVITDKSNEGVKNELLSKFPSAKLISPREGDLIIPKDFNGVLSKDVENVVVVEASKVSLAATVTSILDTKIKDYSITLFTTTSRKVFEDKAIANRYKAKLNFHFPAITKEKLFETNDSFVKRYSEKYKQLPNKYALRGYDVLMDVLLRQAVSGNVENSVLSVGETTYLENKFNYYKSATGGYINKAMYVLRFTPEFQLEEASLTSQLKTED